MPGMTHDPQVLIDAWMDGVVEETAWVEAIVSPERACELVLPFTEDYPEPFDLKPMDVHEWHRPTSDDPTEEVAWMRCEPGDEGAVEFIRIEVWVREPNPALPSSEHTKG